MTADTLNFSLDANYIYTTFTSYIFRSNLLSKIGQSRHTNIPIQESDIKDWKVYVGNMLTVSMKLNTQQIGVFDSVQ